MTEEPHWLVVLSDQAEVDREAAYLHLSQYLGPERANTWVIDLKAALAGLADFPGPLAWPIDEDETKRRGREVRRFLYRGPKKRPIQAAYHVFYTITSPLPGEDEGIISILRIRHAASGDAEREG